MSLKSPVEENISVEGYSTMISDFRECDIQCWLHDRAVCMVLILLVSYPVRQVNELVLHGILQGRMQGWLSLLRGPWKNDVTTLSKIVLFTLVKTHPPLCEGAHEEDLGF